MYSILNIIFNLNILNYQIIEWKHSADKNHTTMTGWTLTIDKIVACAEWVTFYTYSIPMYTGEFDENFHKGVHCAEHLLAYKKDTGSVRNSLEEVTGNQLAWKVILDISPYKTWSNTFGFRITSMVPLPVEQVQELTKISVQRGIKFLKNGNFEDKDDFEWIPFAREISCGQFDFHNKQRAIADLQKINIEELAIHEEQKSTQHTTAYVCDLRFLKPKLKWSNNMVMFSPDFSYQISELIEKYLPSKLAWSITLVGTFGCMTGMYLCVSSLLWDKTDISLIHNSIIQILQEHIDLNTLWEAEKIQFETLLINYNNQKK